MTNRLIAPQRSGGDHESLEARVARWNAGLERRDVDWVVGKDGKPHLEHRMTEFDRDLLRIKAGAISQEEVDRLPFRIRRIAWNRGHLNCDYGDPRRYWVPGRRPEAFTPAPKEKRTGLDWFND